MRTSSAPAAAKIPPRRTCRGCPGANEAISLQKSGRRRCGARRRGRGRGDAPQRAQRHTLDWPRTRPSAKSAPHSALPGARASGQPERAHAVGDASGPPTVATPSRPPTLRIAPPLSDQGQGLSAKRPTHEMTTPPLVVSSTLAQERMDRLRLLFGQIEREFGDLIEENAERTPARSVLLSRLIR